MNIKRLLISIALIILSITLVFCSAPKAVPTEEDVISGGSWYSEDNSACFVFESDSDNVVLYSINSGSNTYNFGNFIIGKYSIEECTVTFGEDVKYYVLDGDVMTIGDEKFILNTQSAPTLNTAPMESAPEMHISTPVSLVPANPVLNEKIYLKFTPENNGRFLFDFAISDVPERKSDVTHIWILNSEFNEVIQGNDNVEVFLEKSATYYIIATISAVSSDTGTNTLTVLEIS